jgi:integrase
MASVFKRGRWVDAHGRKCVKETPGAKYVESRFYTVQVFMCGKPRFVKGYTDKAASEQMGAKLERAKAQGETGLVDPYKEHCARALAEHVRDWADELLSIGRSVNYVRLSRGELGRLIRECGWSRLGDITADSYLRWRVTAKSIAGDHMRKHAVKKTVMLTPRATNKYTESLRAFCRWCLKRGRIPVNPIATVEPIENTGLVRRGRKALSEEEIIPLLAVVNDVHLQAYRLALWCGLRRSELAQLRWGDVHSNALRPFIQFRAETTKSRRADAIPLRHDLAELLKAARGDAADDELVCMVPSMRQHRSYLKAAGIPWQDERGRRSDFHSMRTSFGTLLSTCEVSPRMAMALMRHTDMRLTMQNYTDPAVFDLTGAVEKLPACRQDTQRSVGVATGTDHFPVDSGRSESVSSRSAGTEELSATIGEGMAKGTSSQLHKAGGLSDAPAVIGGDAGLMQLAGVEPATYGSVGRRSIQLS